MEVLNTVERIARTEASVLITGESGTGKELIAEAIHQNSLRAQKPFVKVNLGGISQTLFESEMFGHKRGAFTDGEEGLALLKQVKVLAPDVPIILMTACFSMKLSEPRMALSSSTISIILQI